MRVDMSEWLMHFIHQPSDEIPPSFCDAPDYTDRPAYHIDATVNARFENWFEAESESLVESADSAFNVLQHILEDGHIRSSWAMRRGRATIYGPRPAVCFTEMPLYALCSYAEARGDLLVKEYAIAVKKEEFFAVGGRPAIYGLSGKFKELSPGSTWPRLLDLECGIGEREMYRYVSLNLGGNRPIDWTHEREWRWCDTRDRCSCPGLPVWLGDEPITFSEVVVIVRTISEAEIVLEQLKKYYDRGWHDYLDIPYKRDLLETTKVLALEEVRNRFEGTMPPTIRLDDLPVHWLKRFVIPSPTPELMADVKCALHEGRVAAEKAAAEHYESHKASDGIVHDVCGFAYVVSEDGQAPVIQAMLELGEAKIVGNFYYISDFSKGVRDQALSNYEAAARTAVEVLRKAFPETGFHVRSRWD